MKVKELIELLQKMPQELEVYGVSDHGQSPEQISAPQIIFIEKEVNTLWDNFTTDKNDAFDWNFNIKAILL
jgi:hypothetical protein